jgi:hypothetical protein
MLSADAPTLSLKSRAIVTELLEQTAKSAIVDHIVKVKFFGEQPGRLGAQKQSVNVDLTFRGGIRDNQETKTIHAPLKSAVCLLTRNHGLV